MAQGVSSGADPYVGLVLDSQFRIDELIGKGAMARVYRAHQLGVERSVALKILRRELLERPEIVSRFRHEAGLVARLDHPNVVAVHAVGEVSATRAGIGGEPYVVFEWLDGCSLAELLSKSGQALPLARALHIVLALSDAVGEAHAHGIVHRDLKPENVMLVTRGSDPEFVKLLDFGLAKALEDRAPDFQTRAGSVLGTPRYVSPEGAEGGAVSFASDCYSLATLLYECLAGRAPFVADSAVALLAAQVTCSPPPLRSLERSRDVPEPVARLIMQNLEKSPERRDKDARAFGRALADAARSAGLDTEQFGPSPTLLGTRAEAVVVLAAAKPDAVTVASAPASPSARKRRATFARLALFLACFLMGALAAFLIAGKLTGCSMPTPPEAR